MFRRRIMSAKTVFSITIHRTLTYKNRTINSRSTFSNLIIIRRVQAVDQHPTPEYLHSNALQRSFLHPSPSHSIPNSLPAPQEFPAPRQCDPKNNTLALNKKIKKPRTNSAHTRVGRKSRARRGKKRKIGTKKSFFPIEKATCRAARIDCVSSS